MHAGEKEVTLAKGKKTWRVDLTNLDTIKQYPLPQPAFQFKWRHVRWRRRKTGASVAAAPSKP